MLWIDVIFLAVPVVRLNSRQPLRRVAGLPVQEASRLPGSVRTPVQWFSLQGNQTPSKRLDLLSNRRAEAS
jgi:hypothetical protein